MKLAHVNHKQTNATTREGSKGRQGGSGNLAEILLYSLMSNPFDRAIRVRDSSGKQREKCKQIATVLIEESLFRSRRNLATCCEHTRHNRRRPCTCQFAVNYAYSRVKPDTKLSLPLPLPLCLSQAASIPLTLAIGSNYIMTIAGRRPAARWMWPAKPNIA